MVAARYQALQENEDALSKFVEEQQEMATQMIHVSYLPKFCPLY
jgi:hypothetical protein